MKGWIFYVNGKKIYIYVKNSLKNFEMDFEIGVLEKYGVECLKVW